MTEIQFEVPWGIVAAKTYGDSSSPPVLLLHGVLDNAGSFDRIIPYLPPSFYYVCLDLPGHGNSSWFPQGFRIDFMEYVLTVNRVVRQLSWQQFVMIGHSLGGLLGQYYAAIYPEQVLKLIVFDAYGPTDIPVKKYLDYIKETHEIILKTEKLFLTTAPSYPSEVVLKKVMTGRRTPLTREAALPIVARNVRKTATGVQFKMDPRLKLMLDLPLSHKQHSFNYTKINCPFLLILSEELHFFFGIGNPVMVKKSYVGSFQQNRNFKLIVLEGGHDLHNVTPELVGPHVSEFLLHKKSVL